MDTMKVGLDPIMGGIPDFNEFYNRIADFGALCEKLLQCAAKHEQVLWSTMMPNLQFGKDGSVYLALYNVDNILVCRAGVKEDSTIGKVQYGVDIEEVDLLYTVNFS